ncbi:winged helix-turn-helix domain-containing protein, partial [Cutibacterium acnes]
DRPPLIMSIPSYDQFIEPILRFLAAHPEGARARDAMEAAADALGLTEADRLAMLPSGMQAVYRNRAGWAHDRLQRAGLSSSPRRGFGESPLKASRSRSMPSLYRRKKSSASRLPT